jgi:hypothetical protein
MITCLNGVRKKERKKERDDVSMTDNTLHAIGWDLAQWSEKCASILKITGLNPSGGSELTFHSDLLLTATGCST